MNIIGRFIVVVLCRLGVDCLVGSFMGSFKCVLSSLCILLSCVCDCVIVCCFDMGNFCVIPFDLFVVRLFSN